MNSKQKAFVEAAGRNELPYTRRNYNEARTILLQHPYTSLVLCDLPGHLYIGDRAEINAFMLWFEVGEELRKKEESLLPECNSFLT